MFTMLFNCLQNTKKKVMVNKILFPIKNKLFREEYTKPILYLPFFHTCLFFPIRAFDIKELMDNTSSTVKYNYFDFIHFVRNNKQKNHVRTYRHLLNLFLP